MADLDPWVTVAVTAAGFVSGVLASLLGVGGAVLTTPFIRFLGATPIAAVGSTVPAILPGALAGSLRYHREGYIVWPVALTCGLSGICLAAVGAWVAGLVDARWLMVVTALLVLWSGATLLRSTRSPDDGSSSDEPGPTTASPPSPPRTRPTLLVGLGVTAGFLAGLLGIGGGLVLTPGLAVIARLPVKRAIATSLVAVAMMSVTAMTAHIALGHVDWHYALPLALGIVPGARLGARVTVGASERTMQRVCGVLLVVLALVYLGRELAGIF